MDIQSAQLIEGEYDSIYWGESENTVLKKAFEAIKQMPENMTERDFSIWDAAREDLFLHFRYV